MRHYFELAANFNSFNRFKSGNPRGMYSDIFTGLFKTGAQIFQIGIGGGLIAIIGSVLIGFYLYSSSGKDKISLGTDRIKRGIIGFVALSGGLIGGLNLIFGTLNAILK